MGGAQSARSIHVVEDAAGPGMVKVSEDVARRIMGQPDVVERPQSSKVHPFFRVYRPEHRKLVVETEGLQRPCLPKRMKGVSNADIEKLENYYKEKISRLQLQNAELYQTTTEQFANAVEEVEQKFLTTNYSTVCTDLQNEVLKCYRENPEQTLKCATQVKAFNDCVRKHREKVLLNKG